MGLTSLLPASWLHFWAALDAAIARLFMPAWSPARRARNQDCDLGAARRIALAVDIEVE